MIFVVENCVDVVTEQFVIVKKVYCKNIFTFNTLFVFRFFIFVTWCIVVLLSKENLVIIYEHLLEHANNLYVINGYGPVIHIKIY